MLELWEKTPGGREPYERLRLFSLWPKERRNILGARGRRENQHGK